MSITYEKFIEKIKKQGISIDSVFKYRIGRLKNDLLNKARLEITTTNWPYYRTGGLFRSLRVEHKITSTGLEVSLQAGHNITYAPKVEYG